MTRDEFIEASRKAWPTMSVKQRRERWVEALRSGLFKQGRSYLRHRNENYCCLGVLCEISEPPSHDIENAVWRSGYSDSAPNEISDSIDMTHNLGNFDDDDEQYESLAHMNDCGRGFREIADMIEREPAGLFED